MATTVPGRAADKMPSGPASTSRTWASVLTMIMMHVAAVATSAGLAATDAPLAANRAVDSSRTSQTVRPPGQSTRLRHIGPPMSPNPMKPTGSNSSATITNLPVRARRT